MTGPDHRTAAIQLAPAPLPREPGRPAERQIIDHADPGNPRVLVTLPNRYAYHVLAALLAAYRAGQAADSTGPRYDDPRWWTSTCSRCDGTEFHTADCGEAGSVQCEHCGVAVVAYKAAAAREPGWWHGPDCPLFATREPDTETDIEIQGKLTKAQFRRVFELLGRPADRYKAWCSGPYHFGSSPAYGPLTVELADAVCAYLQDIGVPYQRETARTWSP
jgi:hypothetical protein